VFIVCRAIHGHGFTKRLKDGRPHERVRCDSKSPLNFLGWFCAFSFHLGCFASRPKDREAPFAVVLNNMTIFSMLRGEVIPCAEIGRSKTG
jgi:hypothetical protein